MNRNLVRIFNMAAILVAISFSVTQAGEGNLKISIEHLVGKNLLRLDSGHYENALHQPYTVTKFKYYIGKIKFKKTKGGYFNLNDYFLVNEENALSKQIVVTGIPEDEYSGIEFIIGVDSSDNCSGAQLGALDPINAMFWAWNTGYIFLKLEGFSTNSKSPGNIFEYHIGGYKQPANCVRSVALSFDSKLVISERKTPCLKLSANVEEILQNPNSIDFSRISSVTDFHNAASIANNYANMFSFVAIIQ